MFKKLQIGKSTSGPEVDRRTQKIIGNCGILKWTGGDSKHYTNSPKGITPDLWRKWNDSLAKHPSLLTMDMTLVPIPEVVSI